MTHAIVLLSGGIDSAVCLAMAANRDEMERITPIHFDYGQQTAELERKMAREQCIHLAQKYDDTIIEKTPVLDYRGVFSYFAEGVAEEGKDFGHMTEDDGRSSGYVPMRNLHFLASGAAVADSKGADEVYHGAQGGDEADYPDCRPGFMAKANGAINLSLPDGERMEVRNPLIGMSKPEVIQAGDTLGINFEATYSCYTSTDPDNPEPCLDCPACEERLAAFEEAGVTDPYSPSSLNEDNQ